MIPSDSGSDRTVRNIAKEIKCMPERYRKNAVTGEGKSLRINLFAFADYWKNKTRLRDKNMRKHVDPFDPVEWAWIYGFYSETFTGTEG